MIFYAAGDPGGSRVLLPVIEELSRRGVPATVLDHGFLGKELPPGLRECLCPESEAGGAIQKSSAFVFGSSVRDALPLQLGRFAGECKVPVVHILDNWSNYVRRLCHDGREMLLPDAYAVMDAEAREEAILDGVPERCLAVTGHPGLADMESVLEDGVRAAQRGQFPPWADWPRNKLCLAFASEPFSQIFGGSAQARDKIGFAESDVFTALVRALVPYKNDIFLLLLPHPKQSDAEVQNMLALAGGAFSGMALRPPRGRDILPYVAGVCGVGSLLLYEAWLAGIPVLSAQFGLKRVGMRRLADLDGVHYHVGAPAFEKSCAAWLEQCRAGRAAVRPELGMHAESAARAADMVQALMAGK